MKFLCLFSLLFYTKAFAINDKYIQFDSIRIILQGKKCGPAACYTLPYEMLEVYNVKKIVDTDLNLKYIKIFKTKEGYLFKIYDTI